MSERHPETLAEIVRAVSKRRDVCDAVAVVYAAAEREINARRPVCVMSGRCCRFEEFGHRLYVTTIELAAFARGLEGMRLTSNKGETGHTKRTGENGSRALPVAPLQPLVTGNCPFQVEKLCGAHSIRPFGCRMFFCDATATQWQNEAYERFHADLKALHGRLGVPYFYVEWRGALAALGLLPEPAGDTP